MSQTLDTVTVIYVAILKSKFSMRYVKSASGIKADQNEKIHL